MEPLEVRINVEIYQRSGGGTLRVSESVELPARGFLELCSVLAQFHALSESLRGAPPPRVKD